jgi:DNA-directed RNA polymerase I, II, and III subunit RPABC2
VISSRKNKMDEAIDLDIEQEPEEAIEDMDFDDETEDIDEDNKESDTEDEEDEEEESNILSNIDDIVSVYEAWESNRENRISNPILTKYERASVLGIRSEQISGGAPPNIKVPPGTTKTMDIAIMELTHGKLPFMIIRTLPGNVKEYWKVSELVDIHN